MPICQRSDRASIDMKIELLAELHRRTGAVVDEAGDCESARVVVVSGAA